ncbi:MAG TPA: RNA polymerase sigma factor RpoD/SigA [Candidatus Polarisedimenticolia bacterium]|nr:RNA polymerase sigma factor RpoD/SigA [Candidatus Polarisedimenticolia bacterium]
MSRRVEKDSCLGRYLSEIGEYSILTKEQEMEIARTAEQCGSKDTLNRLVESNLSFVVKIANEYRNLGLPFEDLLNEGNIGLIEAAQRYDHNKGTKFITYAIWWVRKSILKALSEQSNLVRVPTYQMKKVKRIREAEATLSRELGRSPGRDELSRRLESTISKIDEILMIKLREVSLDDKVGRDKSIPISDYLVDDASANPEEEFLRNESEDLVREAIVMLTEQEKVVIANRFGMQGGRSFTLKEIGESMGLSRERIRQIEAQAKKKLRRIFSLHKYASSPTRGALPVQAMIPLRGQGSAEPTRGRTLRPSFPQPAGVAVARRQLKHGPVHGPLGSIGRVPLSLVPKPGSN